MEADTKVLTKPVMCDGPTKFSMRGLPLLAEGASFDAVASTDNLWLSVKVYASGGENALHAHSVEDHAFVVLQGRATFHLGDGSSCEVKQYEGIMLPKGSLYRFDAGEEENLVLIRIGGAQRKNPENRGLRRNGMPDELLGLTYDADGTIKDGRNPKTGTPSRKIVPLPGKYFP